MKKIVILDHRTSEVCIYNYDDRIYEDAYDVIDKNGNFVIHSDCEFMIVDEVKIKIE